MSPISKAAENASLNSFSLALAPIKISGDVPKVHFNVPESCDGFDTVMLCCSQETPFVTSVTSIEGATAETNDILPCKFGTSPECPPNVTNHFDIAL